jgi:hypothetical protein
MDRVLSLIGTVLAYLEGWNCQLGLLLQSFAKSGYMMLAMCCLNINKFYDCHITTSNK